MVARRLISALLIALTISGVFTFWLSRKVSRNHVAAAPRQQYVAASNNLDAGTVLKPENLKLIDWPSTSQLDGAFVKVEDLAGRTLLFPMAMNEPVTQHQLAAIGAGAGLAARIPDGMRAISLKSNEVIGVAGFLLPGTHVDVLVTYHQQDGNAASQQNQITSTILQNVQVLAAGQKIQPDPEGKATTVDVVTLLVKPEDAERAVLASSLGAVQFVLRNGSDREETKNGPMQAAQLDGTPARPIPPPRSVVATGPRHEIHVLPPQPYQVETTLGTKASVESFK